MSQGAINIDHSRLPSSGETANAIFAAAAEKRKDVARNGKTRADFRNLLRYNRNSGAGERVYLFSLSPERKVRVSLSLSLSRSLARATQIAYSLFAA